MKEIIIYIIEKTKSLIYSISETCVPIYKCKSRKFNIYFQIVFNMAFNSNLFIKFRLFSQKIFWHSPGKTSSGYVSVPYMVNVYMYRR